MRHPRCRLQCVDGHCYYHRYICNFFHLFKFKFKFFYEKKLIFGHFFFFSRPEFGQGRLGHSQSLEYFNLILCFKIQRSQKVSQSQGCVWVQAEAEKEDCKKKSSRSRHCSFYVTCSPQKHSRMFSCILVGENLYYYSRTWPGV